MRSLLHWLKPCHASEVEGTNSGIPTNPFMKPTPGLQSGLEDKGWAVSSSPQERREAAYTVTKLRIVRGPFFVTSSWVV
jgi:hypothetical protein